MALDPMSQALRRIIWRKRRAYLAEAVRRGIIGESQAAALADLHRERDAELDAREASTNEG